MTFIIHKSKSGRFKYGKRHPRDGKKWAFMSQGSYRTFVDAVREGNMVEKHIQQGLIDANSELRSKNRSLEAFGDDARNQMGDLDFKLGSMKAQRTVFAIVGLIGVAGMIMAMVI